MSTAKIVKPQSKGMVTIPVEFREKLGINSDSLLEVKMINNGVSFIKINYKPQQEIEIYSEKQIKKWLKDDKLDAKTVKRLGKLLK